jgi:hypothetical protein
LIEIYWGENLAVLDKEFIQSINYFIDFAVQAWVMDSHAEHHRDNRSNADNLFHLKDKMSKEELVNGLRENVQKRLHQSMFSGF